MNSCGSVSTILQSALSGRLPKFDTSSHTPFPLLFSNLPPSSNPVEASPQRASPKPPLLRSLLSPTSFLPAFTPAGFVFVRLASILIQLAISSSLRLRLFSLGLSWYKKKDSNWLPTHTENDEETWLSH